MLEETRAANDEHWVEVQASRVTTNQNILSRGKIYAAGDELLPAGHRLQAQDIGLLAEAGAARVEVRRRPSLAVLVTGNEICPPSHSPAAAQIRNSNGPLLIGLARERGAAPLELGIAPDEQCALENAIAGGLANDILVLTGGVSAGMLDLVPRAFASLGVRQIFHKVSLKPGKPVWFGIYEKGSHRCLAFGLPGNPVSAFVCFHLFVRAALEEMSGAGARPNGLAASDSGGANAALVRAHEIRGDRPTYWPARLTIRDGRANVEPLEWKGSADQRCLSRANCLAVFPQGNQTYAADSLVEVLWLG
jgi:molybdopterin molybdotransferase